MNSLQDATVLLVDDNLELAESLAEVLRADGAAVLLVQTAREAIEIAETTQYDLALLDARPSGESLIEAAADLERLGEGAEVILLASNTTMEAAVEAAESGAHGLTIKPPEPESILLELRRSMKLVRFRRETGAMRELAGRYLAELGVVAQAVHGVLLVIDERGNVASANEAAAEVTGLAVERLRGLSMVEDLVPYEDRAEVQQRLQRLFAGGEPVSFQSRLRAGLGGERQQSRWMWWRAAGACLGTAGKVVYAFGLDTIAIPDFDRQSHITEKLAAVGTLSAGLAHEIRNPLNAAGLQLRLLNRRLQALGAEAQLLEPVSLVQSELARLSRLVGEFLQFARPPALVRRSVDVSALARSVVDMEAPAALERGAKIVARLPNGPAEVEGDAEKLRQVILNLLRNAVEAAGKDGTVEVDVTTTELGLRISIGDDGDGIPEQDLARIFEPFFSTKPGGTGLGMSICHSLVTLHGGEVSVDSREGEGTRVSIDLPAVPP